MRTVSTITIVNRVAGILEIAARAFKSVLAVTVLIVAAAQPSLGDQSAGHDHGQALAPAGARHDLSIYQLGSLWEDDRGEVFPLASLQGRPVVLSMIYTSCEYVCPVLVEDVKRIEAALMPDERGRVFFVLVSFDPARDTSKALAAYRVKRDLATDRWVLLTGQSDDVLALAAVLGVRFKPDGRGDFVHSNLITVLDAEGVVRHQQVGAMQDGSASAAALRKMLNE